MKKIFAVLVMVLFGTMTFAQWSAGPGNLYMLSAGNVGIGTSAPTFALQIEKTTGAAQFVMNTTATPTGTGTFNLGQYDMRWNGNTGAFYRNVLRKNMTTGHVEMMQNVRNTAGAFMNFIYVDLDAQRFEIQSGILDAVFNNSGNFFINNGPTQGGAVGIGTTGIASGVKLQVGGKVKCQEVEVAVTPWPDHVFKAGYSLLPLNEVEAYVNANKHLPGVPSEEEVAANGVNVGSMNATLLQKVEELTLYMINLQKENDALKVRVSNLEK